MPGYDHIEDFRCNPSHITGKQQNPGKDKKRSYQYFTGKACSSGKFLFLFHCLYY